MTNDSLGVYLNNPSVDLTLTTWSTLDSYAGGSIYGPHYFHADGSFTYGNDTGSWAMCGDKLSFRWYNNNSISNEAIYSSSMQSFLFNFDCWYLIADSIFRGYTDYDIMR